MTKDEQQTAWHALEVEKVLRDLQVHENGLTSEEASQRLHRYGPNQLQEAPRDRIARFIIIPFVERIERGGPVFVVQRLHRHLMLSRWRKARHRRKT